MDSFTEAYIECALWSSTDDDGNPLDDNYDTCDISESTLQEMKEDCEDFQKNHADLLTIAYKKDGYDSSNAGHDFWLTRNGHGAGFWDRGLIVGNALSQASKIYGSYDLYIGDDGMVHGQ